MAVCESGVGIESRAQSLTAGGAKLKVINITLEKDRRSGGGEELISSFRGHSDSTRL